MGLEEELLSSERDDTDMSPSDRGFCTTNSGEKEKSAGKSEMDTHRWESSILSEQDYSIDQNFLSKIDIDFSQGMTLKAGEMPLPTLVQVADVQRLDEKMNILELCDGKHITSQLARDMVLDVSFSVLTRHEVSKFSVIKIDSASIGDSSIAEDREHFQKLLGKPTFNNHDSYAFMVLEDITVVEEGSKIGHLLWDESNLGSGVFCRSNAQAEDTRAGMNSDCVFPFFTFLYIGVVNFHFPCGKQLQADRKVLMSCSEVWAAHFSDKATFCDQETVKVEDSSPTAFKKLLQWVHGTCPQLPSIAGVFDLLYLAEKYLMKDLQNLLLKKIKEHLKNIPSNAFLVSELNKTNNEEVLQLVLATVDRNILPLILDPQQLNLDFATVSLVLTRPSLHCDEYRLARWLLAWAKHNTPDEEQAADLTSLIKWEHLTEAKVRLLVQRPEANLMGSKFCKEVALRRLNHCKTQLGGMQMAPCMRSERRDSEDESEKYSRLWRKTSPKLSSLEHEYPTSLALPVYHNILTSPLNDQNAFPVILCPDGDTLIRPIISWTDHYKGLKVEILIVGSMGGLKDTSVMRREDYYRHVMDLQLKLVLAYVANGRWTESQAPELDHKNQTCFPLNNQEMQEDLLSGGKTFNGLLKIFQYKRSGEDPGWSSGTESEGEGDDLQDMSDDDDDEDGNDEDGDDLDGFIVDDNEGMEPAGEENEDNNSDPEGNDSDGEDNNSEREDNSDEHSRTSEDEESPINCGRKRKRIIDSDSEEEEEPNVKQKTEECDEEESEYETDDDMGEVAKNKTPEPGKTPAEPNDGEAEGGSSSVQVTFSEDEENLEQQEEMLGDGTPEPRGTPEDEKENDEKTSSPTECVFSDDDVGDGAGLDDDKVTQIGGNWKVTQVERKSKDEAVFSEDDN